LTNETQLARFERLVMPHVGSAYNLARWLTGSTHDAEDVVQEASLRALAAMENFRGGDPRAWLLTIVRNTCFTWMRRDQTRAAEPLDEQAHDMDSPALTPDAALLQAADTQMVRQAIESLPMEYREVLVLRELEGFSYKEIAAAAKLPVGTVMSRLARARHRLQQALADKVVEEA